MYKSVELDYEPRKRILPKINPPPFEPEMSEFESAFLCGILGKFKPKKILEVGVAGGGTTSIVLQSISDLGLDSEVFSVDFSEWFYRDKSKKSGFLAEEALKHLPAARHKLFLGGIAPEFIEEIGGGIDCLILDTVHALPGELLDFLALFPYLKEDAVVILHDLCCNYCTKNRSRYQEMAWCTKLLFDCVAAEKYLMRDESVPARKSFPNIGAFQLTPQTKASLPQVAGSLSITWNYLPDESVMDKYRAAIINALDEEGRWLFEAACKINADILNAPPPPKQRGMRRVLSKWHNSINKRIGFIWGR